MHNLKIIQVSDLHIGYENESPYGVDVRNNFQRIIHSLYNETFDLLVITGDLCFHGGNTNTYKWIKKYIDQLNKPYFIIPGNHDNSKLISKVFGYNKAITGDEIYLLKQFKGHKIIFLDTGKGVMSTEQLKWLKRQINQFKDQIIIFMHYPPALANVPHMDHNWAFQNNKEIQEIFFSIKNNITVFCGHYHVEKSLQIKNLNIYITPSTFFNLRQDTEEFQVENTLVGYRKIEILKNNIFSSVKYLVD